MLTASHESVSPDLRAPFSPKSGDDAEKVGMRGLTCELSGRQRQDARPGLAKMYRVPPNRGLVACRWRSA